MIIRAKDFKFFFMLLADSAVLLNSLIGAYSLRYGIPFGGEHVRQMWALAPVIVPAEVALFGLFGLYRGSWRYTGAFDLWRLAKACSFSMLLAFSYAFLFRLDLSRSLLIMDGILALLMAITLRVCIRNFCEVRLSPEGLEAYEPSDVKILTCPLCGCELHGAHLPPPGTALSCIHSIH